MAMWDDERPSVRSLRVGPLVVAIGTCLLFALFGAALVGGSLGTWYGALDKPWFLVPLWAFYVVGAVYYVLFATVLYRILVHVDDRRGRVASLALAIGLLFLNELWNFGCFGLESTLAGFLRIVVFLVDSAAPYASQARALLGRAGRRLLDMGALRPRLDVRAVAVERRRLTPDLEAEP